MVDKFRSNGHRCRTTTIQIDRINCPERFHNLCTLLEACPDAIAWLAPIHCNEKNRPVRFHTGKCPWIPSYTESVVELRVLRPMETFRHRCNIDFPGTK